jgi:hypothetical protein
MWFGASFWKISQREKLRILRGLSKMSVVADDNNGLLNIQVQAEPFTSASDVAVQNKLREIIYIKNV